MRAVVMETKDGRAVVLEQGGGMRTLRDEGYQVGQILEVPSLAFQETPAKERRVVPFPARARHFAARYGAGIAAAAGIVILAGGVTAYAAPVSTVTLGSDAAVEYRVNVFDRVVDCALAGEERSEETRTLLLKIRGKKLSEAIAVTVTELENAVADDEATQVVVRSAFSGKEKKLKFEAEEELGKRRSHEKSGAPEEKSDDWESEEDVRETSPNDAGTASTSVLIERHNREKERPADDGAASDAAAPAESGADRGADVPDEDRQPTEIGPAGGGEQPGDADAPDEDRQPTGAISPAEGRAEEREPQTPPADTPAKMQPGSDAPPDRPAGEGAPSEEVVETDGPLR